jgi:hypothetical protein
MKLVSEQDKISLGELKEVSTKMAESLVKAVVDIEKNLMLVDAELHVDEEKQLLEQGSEQKNLWGINLYPSIEGEDWIEFDSMINLRPWQNNRSRGVEDEHIRKTIIEIVNKLVER